MSRSDAEVVRRSLEEPEAFGEIFDRHGATLLRFLARRRGTDEAESLLGEVFRVAFERRSTFDAARSRERVRSSARPWLFGIASNLLLKDRRSEARRLRATARLALQPATGDGGMGAAAAREVLLRVVDAIESLPDGEREALLLFAWEEQSYQEIAEALEVPAGTVRSRLNRARERLRELTKAGREEEGESTGVSRGKDSR